MYSVSEVISIHGRRISPESHRADIHSSQQTKRQIAVNVLLNWHLRIFAETQTHTHNRHKLPTHTLQTTGTLAASKHPGLPKASSLISVHAGTLPFSPVSVPPCDPVWVSPGLSSIPGALPAREPRWPDPCPSQPVTRHPATASLLRLLHQD